MFSMLECYSLQTALSLDSFISLSRAEKETGPQRLMFSTKPYSPHIHLLYPSCVNEKKNQPQNLRISKRLKLCTLRQSTSPEQQTIEPKLPFKYIYLQKRYLLLSLTISYKSLCHLICTVVMVWDKVSFSLCLYVGQYRHSSLSSYVNVKMRKAGRNFSIAHVSVSTYWTGPQFSDFNEAGTQPRLSHCSEFRLFSFPAHILFSVTQESFLNLIQSCDRIILLM